MKLLKIFFALSLIFVVSNSCQKREFQAIIDEVILSQQDTQSEEVLTDVDLIVDDALTQNAGQLKAGTLGSSAYLTSCAIITLNNKVSPQLLTIDFGTSCAGSDGKIRSGKIIVTSESFNTFPSIRNKTFQSYIVDGKKIEGNVTKTILKDQVNNIRTATSKEDITITLPNNEGTAHRVADLTRQYLFNSLGVRDDNQVKTFGTVDFTRVSGVKVTKTITAENPLVYSASCHHIVSGIVSITTSTNHTWSIDFGNGECDNKAILTINNKSKEITIR
jgi:hypothetical protein